jgi:hypothetical protein
MSDTLYRIEACNPEKNLDWFTVHGFQGASRRQKVIDTARSMREHMDADFVVRVLERSSDAAEPEVIWKE